VHLFRSGIARLIRDAHLFVVIREQSERKIELVAERLVLVRGVEADSENLAVERFVLLGAVTQALALNRSTGRIGLRIEPQEDPPAALTFERYRPAVLIGHLERWCLSSGSEHAHTLCPLGASFIAPQVGGTFGVDSVAARCGTPAASHLRRPDRTHDRLRHRART
jgi:hypothetical protein